MNPTQSTLGLVVTDGAGDRYEVADYKATFTLRSIDRPHDPPLTVGSATLATLGIEWNGRTLRRIGDA